MSCVGGVEACASDPEGAHDLAGHGGTSAASGGSGNGGNLAAGTSSIGDASLAGAGLDGDGPADSFDGGLAERGSIRVNLPNDVIYASLGDSITNGWNAGVTCQDWPSTPQVFPGYCGEGNSYVVDVARGLTAAKHTVSVVNPAQPSKTIGYVMKVELAEVPVNAGLVSLYIGTNDWRNIANAGSEQAIQDGIRGFQTDFDGVLSSIAERAPNATILLLNVPNQKYVNEGHPADELDRFDRVSVELDRWINGHADKYIVIDNVCDPRTYQKPFRGSNVHPNTAGHQLIADRIVAALSGDAALLPAKSCPPYLAP